MNGMEVIRNELGKLDGDGLRVALGLVTAEIKKRSREKASTLATNTRVRFVGRDSTRLPYGSEGVVERINMRSASVKFAEFGRWRVECAFLEPVA